MFYVCSLIAHIFTEQDLWLDIKTWKVEANFYLKCLWFVLIDKKYGGNFYENHFWRESWRDWDGFSKFRLSFHLKLSKNSLQPDGWWWSTNPTPPPVQSNSNKAPSISSSWKIVIPTKRSTKENIVPD